MLAVIVKLAGEAIFAKVLPGCTMTHPKTPINLHVYCLAGGWGLWDGNGGEDGDGMGLGWDGDWGIENIRDFRDWLLFCGIYHELQLLSVDSH